MDWQSIQPLFTWLSEHPAWSGLIVFLIAFSESLFVVGIIVPGTVLMFGVGTLIGTGVLDIQETLLIAFIGAIAGDGISYWIGIRYNQQLSSIWPLKNKPHYLEHGKAFFKKHGGKSILFGRFIGPVRPFIPAVAGMMGMPAKYFFTINVFSAALWAPFYLLPGIVFGTSIGLASIVGTRLMVMLLVLAVSTFLLVWLIRKTMAFIAPRMESFYLKCYRVAVVNSLFGTAVKAIIDPDTAERRGLYFFSILILLSLTVFTLFIGQFSSSILLVANETVANFVLLTRSTIGDQFLLSVWEFYSWLTLLSTISCCFIFLYIYKQVLVIRHLALLLILVCLAGVFLNFLSEIALQSTVVFANLKILVLTSFVTFIALFVAQQKSFAKRWLIFSLFGFVILMFVLIDLYFGKIKVTEIISSLSISYLWVLLITTAFRRHTISLARVRLRMMVVCMSVVFLMSGSLWASINYDKDYTDIAIKHEKVVVTYQDWWSEKSLPLPFQREDMFGIKKQAMNLQWLGDLEAIKQSLEKNGWEPVVEADYRSVLFWLKPDVSLHELPRIPQTHLGEKEVLVMMKLDGNNEEAKILQLWSSGLKIEKSDIPLWIGSITRQAVSRKARWLASLKVESLRSGEMKVFEGYLLAEDFTVQRSKVNQSLLIISGRLSEK